MKQSMYAPYFFASPELVILLSKSLEQMGLQAWATEFG
jgi:hypothetical protein